MFSPDSSRFAYEARLADKPNRQVVVVDGKEGPEFGFVSDIIFSFDSRYFAYLIRNETCGYCPHYLTINNEMTIGPYDQILKYRFSEKDEIEVLCHNGSEVIVITKSLISAIITN